MWASGLLLLIAFPTKRAFAATTSDPSAADHGSGLSGGLQQGDQWYHNLPGDAGLIQWMLGKSLSLIPYLNQPADPLPSVAVREEQYRFDAVFSQRQGSVRHFIGDIATMMGSRGRTYPVIFDTGSGDTWLVSTRLGSALDPPRTGYFRDPLTKTVRGPAQLEYLTTSTTCDTWVTEFLSFKSGKRGWDCSVCISDTTSVTLKAVSGVVGADLSSPLVQAFGTFWLVPISYPRVGLLLGDVTHPSYRCKEGVMHYSRVPFLTNIWRVSGSMSLGNDVPVSVSARIDTGVNRLYLSRSLWVKFTKGLSRFGVELAKQVPAGDFSTSKCDSIASFPVVRIMFGSFIFDLTPEMYVSIVEDGSRCAIQLDVHDSAYDNEVLIGAPVLTRIVTRWQSGWFPTIGFCTPSIV
jgi:hypothetical protein